MKEAIECHAVQFDVHIEAEIKVVWESLVSETTQWWARDFHTSSKTQGFYIEAQVGGRMFEDFGGGEGLVWAEVIGVDSPNSIQMKGLLAPDFGGPAISFVKLNLIQEGEGTLLKVSDTLFGAVNEGTAAQVESGWKMIYADALKKYVESK